MTPDATAPDMRDANYLLGRIRGGATLFVHTATRVTKVTPATLKRWEGRGHVLLKNGPAPAQGGRTRLLLASGRQFVDIGLCTLVLA